MIVRISGEDQYRMHEADHAKLNELDNAVLAAVQADDEQAFGETYRTLLEFVRANGTRIGEEELEASDLILPPADLTFAEAGAEFTGEGLIPG